MKIHSIQKYKLKDNKFVLDNCNIRRITLLLILILSIFSYFAIQNRFWLPEAEQIDSAHMQKESIQFAAYKQYITTKNKDITVDEASDLIRSVAKYSNKYEIDADLAMGLIEVESTFKKYAISSAGALSYTQVLPNQHLAEIKTFQQQYGHADLFDTEFNLDLGFKILDGYRDRYHSMNKALAQYNGSLTDKDQKYPTAVLNAAKKIKEYRLNYAQQQNQKLKASYAAL